MSNLILAAASFMVIVVALGVLSAMRPGVTGWVQFPAWLAIAMSAFFTMLSDRPASWYEAALVASLAGLLWRSRGRFMWEVMHAGRTTTEAVSARNHDPIG